MEVKNKWADPTEVDAVTAAFPASVVGSLLPEWSEIPEEFKKWRGNKWCEAASKLFFEGGEIPLGSRVDKTAATMHLRAVLGSFEPKHEHKIAGAGWLLSLWND